MLHKTIKQNSILFVSVDKNSGKFEVGGELYEAVEGELLGFGSHEFDFQGRKIRKFDIFLGDGDSIYQLQFGFYSWTTLRLMNSLLSIQSSAPKLLFIASKKNGNLNIFIREGKNYLKWKYPYEKLKLLGLPADQKEKRRNQIIEKWFEMLITLKPFSLYEIEQEAQVEEIEDEDEF